MKPFRERNPTIIGVVGFAVIALMLVAAFRADRLPIIGGGDTYYAEFAEIGGLKAGNEVRVAGVTVGTVDDIELDGNRVRVTFRITDPVEFGEQTGAAVRIRTLLGASFLALTPSGEGQLDQGATIPLARTVAPYDVVEAFSELSDTTSALDVDQVATALETLSEVAEETPEEFRAAIAGVSDLSSNLAARDQEINTLLVNLRQVSGVLNERNTELETLFRDSGTLFTAVTQRREAISDLLDATQLVSTELSLLVDETRADLRPALEKLQQVTDVLEKNQFELDELLRVYPTFLRLFSQALGTGPWFDTFLGISPDLVDGLTAVGAP
ncbi:virulence factor Mce family protein [Aeromicrobium marinum DSM 15272]|uniref:Virulence factor Mce family protein n=1 Tax=Aeromicrobium marinum DSM 15272 TaxID=585531 RepID=E2SGB1_9ACTN|nr:MlaD family protein [Aeromicrobium marinum]EFQ81868.1 virulence factor Mce family protein [Aeromicrobium marinum DSM 15272]